MKLLTRQTLVMSAYFIATLCKFIANIIGLTLPDAYDDNIWRMANRIFTTLRVVMVYILFRLYAWHASDILIPVNDSATVRYSQMESIMAK